ncbi:hypothetical protein NEAUS04_2264 [Nematocida ausubeli]|nr:hypothetical protein NEAUS07_2285 [Nematocida ausubeli]KAI5138169.1 hypothetical protein NEAUS07_2305 [Nematocida ausubeli]KAI5164506.1 hypothetical protein NEAUS04_2251 [Nematocida ausubeli]KAI5164520.1 hypothetical protein NEAUS04_2264 [Nematocida ausubeli]
MKKSREIDQYFKMDENPQGEIEERRPSVRRVSFALEPQIVYSHSKDDHSKSESSSTGISMETTSKMNMEISLEENIMEDDLMQDETLPLCEEKEENFIMDDSEETFEERRMSMCPVDRNRTMEHTACNIRIPSDGTVQSSRSPIKIQSEFETVIPDETRRNSHVNIQEEIISSDRRISTHEKDFSMENITETIPTTKDVYDYTPEDAENNNPEYSLDGDKDDILSDMLSEIVCAADSNTLVYDTVNVEEVLSKYETTKKEETKKMREILAETGIRFLDNLSLGNRRETLSKIRNKVDPSNVIYYREFMQRRIDTQNNLSSGLSAEIERTREETEVIEREVDCTGLSSIDRNALLSKLRQMKSDARKEGKAHWHKKRLTVEKEFLNETERIFNDFEKEKGSLLEKIERLKEGVKKIDLSGLENKEKSMKKVLQTIGSLSQEEVNGFMKEVETNKEEEVILKEKLNGLTSTLCSLKEKNDEITEIIEREKAEIQNIQESLLVEEVQKDDLEQVKSAVQRMEVILGVKILEISHSRLLFSICDLVITVIYDGTNIVDVYAETKTKSLFKEFIALSVGAGLVAMDLLVQSIPVIIRYVLRMTSVEKEVKKLGVSVPYEIHYTEKELSIQFMIRKGKTGEMGHVTAIFKSGESSPAISSNIKGFKASCSRYESISESVNQARTLAHIK